MIQYVHKLCECLCFCAPVHADVYLARLGIVPLCCAVMFGCLDAWVLCILLCYCYCYCFITPLWRLTPISPCKNTRIHVHRLSLCCWWDSFFSSTASATAIFDGDVVSTTNFFAPAFPSCHLASTDIHYYVSSNIFCVRHLLSGISVVALITVYIHKYHPNANKFGVGS